MQLFSMLFAITILFIAMGHACRTISEIFTPFLKMRIERKMPEDVYF